MLILMIDFNLFFIYEPLNFIIEWLLSRNILIYFIRLTYFFEIKNLPIMTPIRFYFFYQDRTTVNMSSLLTMSNLIKIRLTT